MLSCHEIAQYFLSKVDEDAGDSISNLKLQKLVYYGQGFHLAVFDEPLFNEEIVVWQHGPVVVDLYHRYKKYGAGSIPPEEIDLEKYDPKLRELLDEVYSVYGQFSASKLRALTHEEPPWKDTPLNFPIPHELMKTYFKTQISA
ncbi:MAG: DUF4065 domain-containing protein [Acidobacteriia bacterium]|nr:DUF4065 domain-containing protein [Terriglobia bacterium]